jgi:redox-sensitive bicupin YhaK (pirin superfamily)
MRLRAGKTAKLNVPAGQSTALLFLHGGGRVNAAKSVDEGQLVVLEREGETLSVEAGADSTILLLSGAPLDEPVVGYGPFVMNTEKEIRQAMSDYRSGLMGHLD